MAQENLDVNINGEDNLSGPAKSAKESIDDIGNAAERTGKRTRRGGRAASSALINLGRGASDARFGFHGLANNLEVVAELMGHAASEAKETGVSVGKQLRNAIIGPAGAVVALTVLIAYGPEIVKFFKRIIDGTSGATAELAELRGELQGLSLEAALERQAQLTEDLRQKTETLRRTQGELIFPWEREGREARVQQLQNDIAAIGQSMFGLSLRIKELNQIEPFESLEGLQEDIDNLVPALDEVFRLIPEHGIIDPEDVEVIDDMTDALDDLQSALELTGSAFANMSDEQAAAWAKAQESFDASRTTILSASDHLISAFESAAVQGGNFFENLGAGILSAIGSLLVKEGSAYIALGIARNAAFPGSGAKVLTSGAALVGAGVALKAGGAAIGNRSRSSETTTPGNRAIARTADTTSTNASVQFRIGNNELIGSLQQGLNKRGTTHGSATLFPG